MRLREIERADLDEVAQLHTDIWKIAYRGMVPDTALDALEWTHRRDLFAPWFDDPMGTWLVAIDDDGAVTGHVLAAPVPAPDFVESGEAETRHGELLLLYVAPDQWGTGLGAELLAAGERILRRHGCDTAELWTFESNERSQRFYNRHGWELDGRSKVDEKILPGSAITEVCLRKTLETDSAVLNRSYWADQAGFFAPLGERAWTADASWGIFAIPESEVGLLHGVQGCDVLEVGCGTGYVSKFCLDAGAASVVGLDNSPDQLATAQRLARTHDTRLPLVQADGQRLPFPDASFDFAISEYGAAIWCDPAVWIPEVARVLRPGGRLAFLGNSFLLMMCMPEWEGLHVGERLRRAQRSMGRLDWFDVDGVEFHVSHGEMIRIINDAGLRVEALRELYAPADAASDFDFVTVDWGSRWPVEEAWIATKPRA